MCLLPLHNKSVKLIFPTVAQCWEFERSPNRAWQAEHRAAQVLGEPAAKANHCKDMTHTHTSARAHTNVHMQMLSSVHTHTHRLLHTLLTEADAEERRNVLQPNWIKSVI